MLILEKRILPRTPESVREGKDPPLVPANIPVHEDPGAQAQSGKVFLELEVWGLTETLRRQEGRLAPPEQVSDLCPVWSQGLGRWQEEGADCYTVRGWGGQRAHSAMAPHHSLGHEPAVYGLQVTIPTFPSLLGQGQKSPKKKSHSNTHNRKSQHIL